MPQVAGSCADPWRVGSHLHPGRPCCKPAKARAWWRRESGY